MTNQAQKTLAVLIKSGRAIAQCYTSANSGDVLSYGFEKSGNALIECGKAKVSRAKKYLADQELMHQLSMQDDALVNVGGGECI